MISSTAVANELAAVFVPIGIIGTVIAVICAIVAMVAIGRGSVGVAGGAIGVWIGGTMLSIAASFANEWMPLTVSGVALAAALTIGGITRSLVGARTGRGRPA